MSTLEIHRPSTLGYRPDIDGLRAVAVLSVVGAHAAVPGMTGGFVGVDVFFVISGYLISRIILGRIDEGKLSLSEFYLARVRRLFPALFATIIITSGFVAVTFTPAASVDFWRSVIWSVTFVANIHFHYQTGYFAPDAETLPLLHIWSLGVEEQFYLFFPAFILLICTKNKKLLVPIVLLLLVASLCYAEYATRYSPGSAFFLPQFRMWELLLGCLLARFHFLGENNTQVRCAAGGCGLTLIVLAIVMFSPDTPSPGFYLLVPCVGAALLIWGNAGPATHILKLPILVSIGRASYSLYLVHWPVAVFVRQLMPAADDLERILVILLASTVFTLFIYHLVEQPLRQRRYLHSNMKFLTWAGGGVVLLLAVAVTSITVLPRYTNTQVQKLEAFRDYPYQRLYREGECFLRPEQEFLDLDRRNCVPKGQASVVLWGDSFAAHYFPGFLEVLEPRGTKIGLIAASACPPIPGLKVPDRPNCRDFNLSVLELLIEHRPSVVVLSAYWARTPLDTGKIEQAIDKLLSAGIKVVVLGQSPVYGKTVPELAVRRLLSNEPFYSEPTDLSSSLLEVDRKVGELGRRTDILFVSVLDEICENFVCPLLAGDDTPFHWDEAHLTQEAAVAITERISDRLIPLILKPDG